jgi:hypothetical protein
MELVRMDDDELIALTPREPRAFGELYVHLAWPLTVT